MAMQRLPLAVTVRGEQPRTVPSTPLAIVETEKHFKLSYLEMFGEKMRMECVNFLAYRTFVHMGLTQKEGFLDWLGTLEDVDIDLQTMQADAVPKAED